uniref:SprT-like domain-containing protein n=1 Tax=Acrobeloides nanus TaxID=290746 RepID=A0A914EJV4_9BILA
MANQMANGEEDKVREDNQKIAKHKLKYETQETIVKIATVEIYYVNMVVFKAPRLMERLHIRYAERISRKDGVDTEYNEGRCYGMMIRKRNRKYTIDLHKVCKNFGMLISTAIHELCHVIVRELDIVE